MQIDIFEKAFGVKRNPNYKRGGRKLSDLSKLFSGGTPKYVVFYTIAQQSYANGNLQSALENINKTIELSDIDDWMQYAFKANVLEDLQMFQKAIENYKIAIDINGEDVNRYALYHQIGFCYLNLGDHEKAIKFYTHAIDLKGSHQNSQLNPDQEGINQGILLGVPFKRMYVNRGNSYKTTNKLNEAFEDAKKALSYDKDYSNPYILISQIFSQAGQEDKAVEFMRHAAQLGNRNAQLMLSKIESDGSVIIAHL